MAVNGTFEITQSEHEQCVTFTVLSDGLDESDRECFVVRISVELSNIPSLTIAPPQAAVCIIDTDG